MSRCAYKDCERAATHYPCLVAPAMGFPATPANSLQLVCGLAACHEQDLAQLLPETRARLNAVLAAQGKVPADFDRCRVEARPLGDKAWQIYKSMRAEGLGGGNA
jgi:hypothetical protein